MSRKPWIALYVAGGLMVILSLWLSKEGYPLRAALMGVGGVMAAHQAGRWATR